MKYVSQSDRNCETESPTITFIVSLEPTAKARPRATVGKTGKPLLYTPRKTRSFEAKVAAIAERYFSEPFKGAVSIELTFLMPRPKRLYRKSDPEGEVPHVSKPDLDNLEKSLIDGLTGIAFLDDKQICVKTSRKMYHAKNGSPRITVKIESLK